MPIMISESPRRHLEIDFVCLNSQKPRHSINYGIKQKKSGKLLNSQTFEKLEPIIGIFALDK